MNDHLTPGRATVAMIEDEAAPVEVAARRSLRERGLTTVEYAVGIVLVITIVGLLIAAAQQGWFMDLVKALIKAIFATITGAFIG